MTSQDVIHSFFVPTFRVKQDVLPGRCISLWIEPTHPGTCQLHCAEFRGTGHSRMTGKVHVPSPTAFNAWLAEDPDPDSLAAQGETRFRRFGQTSNTPRTIAPLWCPVRGSSTTARTSRACACRRGIT